MQTHNCTRGIMRKERDESKKKKNQCTYALRGDEKKTYTHIHTLVTLSFSLLCVAMIRYGSLAAGGVGKRVAV